MRSNRIDITSAHPRSGHLASRPWCISIALALGGLTSCVGERPRSESSQSSHLFSDYEVIEVSAYSVDSSSSLWPGTLIRLSNDEISVYREPSAWARMSVEWLDRSDEEQLVGAYRRSGDVELREANGFLSIVENGHELALAARVTDRLALEALNALPSRQEIQDRTQACLEAYTQAFPNDVEMMTLDPKSFGSTSSARGVVQLAAVRLARAGLLPVPAPCKTVR